jgi:peptide-methionine (S)-S-oxide reductase
MPAVRAMRTEAIVTDEIELRAGSATDPSPAPGTEVIFAGGCFWCTESDFDKVPGVLSTVSGYTGGHLVQPTYEHVTAGGTGHFEAVQIRYDPDTVGYATLVQIFLRTIDPFDGEGQFCDRGDQYRSAIFVNDDEERLLASAAKAQAEAGLGSPIATLILPASRFFPAEDYHQDYYRKNPVRYRFYRFTCGRDARLKRVWGS